MLLFEANEWMYAPKKAMHVVALLKISLSTSCFFCDVAFEWLTLQWQQHT